MEVSVEYTEFPDLNSSNNYIEDEIVVYLRQKGNNLIRGWEEYDNEGALKKYYRNSRR